MGDFAAPLLLLRDVEKLLCFLLADFGIGKFAGSRNHPVIILHDRNEQSPRGESGPRLRDRRRQLRPAIIRNLDRRVDVPVDLYLIVVDVRSVVGDKYPRRQAVRLCVDELVKRLGVRQQSGFGLNGGLPGDQCVDVRRQDLRTELACALQSLCKRQCEPGTGGRRLCKPATADNKPERCEQRNSEHRSYKYRISKMNARLIAGRVVTWSPLWRGYSIEV